MFKDSSADTVSLTKKGILKLNIFFLWITILTGQCSALLSLLKTAMLQRFPSNFANHLLPDYFPGSTPVIFYVFNHLPQHAAHPDPGVEYGMDNSLTPDEERRFSAWRYSPSVSSNSRDELIVAFKLGKLLRMPSSKVLKALRGWEGLPPELVEAVAQYVANDPSLELTGEAPHRLVVFRVHDTSDR